MKTTKDFVFFWKTEEVFSQWHPSTFVVDGITFKTAEQYMMYQKALTFNDEDAAARVLSTTDPREQKKIGRSVKNFDPLEWSAKAMDVVYAGNKEKFQQNPSMLIELLKTGDKELVEASPYDTIWGIGLDESDERSLNKTQWLGTNWLGIVLTNLRAELQKERMELRKLQLIDSAEKEMEDFAIKYPDDIGRLYTSYKTLYKQTEAWEKPFLNGYLSAISDLIIIKKGHWA